MGGRFFAFCPDRSAIRLIFNFNTFKVKRIECKGIFIHVRVSHQTFHSIRIVSVAVPSDQCCKAGGRRDPEELQENNPCFYNSIIISILLLHRKRGRQKLPMLPSLYAIFRRLYC